MLKIIIVIFGSTVILRLMIKNLRLSNFFLSITLFLERFWQSNGMENNSNLRDAMEVREKERKRETKK